MVHSAGSLLTQLFPALRPKIAAIASCCCAVPDTSEVRPVQIWTFHKDKGLSEGDPVPGHGESADEKSAEDRGKDWIGEHMENKIVLWVRDHAVAAPQSPGERAEEGTHQSIADDVPCNRRSRSLAHWDLERMGLRSVAGRRLSETGHSINGLPRTARPGGGPPRSAL